ncbi:MAG: hypothetical protein BRC45_04810 [Cyanobacteria bacterium QS_5_48_63]|nr:MAG: hypothetical protein BRC45_04810 [Cyanobacteria bacterium QS_5_48_63]
MRTEGERIGSILVPKAIDKKKIMLLLIFVALLVVGNWLFSTALVFIPVALSELARSAIAFGLAITLVLLLSWSFGE